MGKYKSSKEIINVLEHHSSIIRSSEIDPPLLRQIRRNKIPGIEFIQHKKGGGSVKLTKR